MPNVRSAQTSDIPAVTAIYAHYVLHNTATFEIEAPSVEEMTRRWADVMALGFPYLVAEESGVVLGYAYVRPFHPRAAYRDTVENGIYLHPESLGRGVGKLLMKRLIQDCESIGLRQMIAVIGGSGNVASIRLHESLGFRRAGQLQSVGFKHNQWLDTVYFQLPLGAGDSKIPDRQVP
jgi:L-amino acid N-acyltransferase YncA